MAKILFFSPQAGFWEHAYAAAQIAEALQLMQHEITYVSCHEDLKDHCIIIAGASQHESAIDRKKICEACIHNKNKIIAEFDFNFEELGNYISTDDHKKADAISKTVDFNSLIDFKYKDYEVGKYSVYEFLLFYKKTDLNFTPHQQELIRKAIKNCILNIDAAEALVQKHHPERLAVYNSAYSTNRAFYEVARKFGIETISMHGGLNFADVFKSMILPTDYTFKYFDLLKKNWNVFKNFRINKSNVEKVLAHFELLFNSTSLFAYSAPKNSQTIDVRKALNIPIDKKLVLMTLSSYDERFASETCDIFPKYDDLLFPLQVDWIKETIKWAKNRDDVFLLIRVHPREFPNKRGASKSQHAQLLSNELQNLPANVRINWPTDNISIYDLALTTDAVLNAWSSVGPEMSAFGVPVVLYSKELPLYPSEINYCSEQYDSYFKQVETAMYSQFNIDTVRNALRWLYLSLNAASVEFPNRSDLYFSRKNPFFIGLRILEKLFKMVLIKKFLVKFRKKTYKESELLEKWFFTKQPPVTETVNFKYTEISEQQENEAIRYFIKKLFKKLNIKEADQSIPRIKNLSDYANKT